MHQKRVPPDKSVIDPTHKLYALLIGVGALKLHRNVGALVTEEVCAERADIVTLISGLNYQPCDLENHFPNPFAYTDT
jgi:hypothetical protein